MNFFLTGKKRKIWTKSQICSAGQAKAFLGGAHTSPGGDRRSYRPGALGVTSCSSPLARVRMETQNIYEPQSEYVQTRTNGTWLWGRVNQTMGFF